MRFRLFKPLILLCALPAAHQAAAQSLPPIYDTAPVRLLSASTLAEYPAGTFLENIAVDRNNQLFVTSYPDGKVYRISLSGEKTLWATIDGTIAGIALDPDGSAFVSGWIKGKDPAVFKLDATGRHEVLVRLPEAMFPNSVVRLAPGRFLVADSYKGVIWEIDETARTASTWLAHEWFTRASPDNSTPAINGLKVFGGALYASNTARQLLVRVPLNGTQPGSPEVLRTQLGLDEFDFDSKGTLYGTTHVYNSLISLSPEGQVTVIAGLAEGMAGSTAVAAIPAGPDVHLYVTTNGGMSLPPNGGVQTGKVVRVVVPGS